MIAQLGLAKGNHAWSQGMHGAARVIDLCIQSIEQSPKKGGSPVRSIGINLRLYGITRLIVKLSPRHTGTTVWAVDLCWYALISLTRGCKLLATWFNEPLEKRALSFVRCIALPVRFWSCHLSARCWSKWCQKTSAVWKFTVMLWMLNC